MPLLPAEPWMKDLPSLSLTWKALLASPSLLGGLCVATCTRAGGRNVLVAAPKGSVPGEEIAIDLPSSGEKAHRHVHASASSRARPDIAVGAMGRGGWGLRRR
eukprot:1719103-Pleurochrysis_carterae.AAC.1